MEEKGPAFLVNEYLAPAGGFSVCEVHVPHSPDSTTGLAARDGYYETRDQGKFQLVEEARARCHALGYTLQAVNFPHAVERWIHPPRP
jgi:hypothetical protein